jgi:CheY-like chemotaxis protein
VNDKRVLVVDDDDELSELVRDALEAGGFSVVTASNGAGALDHLRGPGLARGTESPAVMLVDLHLPDMTGWQLIDAVHELDGHSKRPIVVLTGQSRTPQGKASRVLVKPVDADELVAVLESYCA